MPLELRRYNDATTFKQRVEAYLMRREAEHNLPLGLLGTLSRNPRLYSDTPPYLALVEDAGEVLGVAVMTPPYNLVVAARPIPGVAEALARDVYAARPDMPGCIGLTEASQAVAQAWQAVTGAGYRLKHAERIYKLERVLPVANVSGSPRRVEEANRELLVSWFRAFAVEAQGDPDDPERQARLVDGLIGAPPEQRGGFVWLDPEPVCYVGYGRPTPHGMSIGPVYTPPERRRRGYATALTARPSLRSTASIAAATSAPCTPTSRTRPRTPSTSPSATNPSATSTSLASTGPRARIQGQGCKEAWPGRPGHRRLRTATSQTSMKPTDEVRDTLDRYAVLVS
jgi:predicted GNAT family acetyltransferase